MAPTFFISYSRTNDTLAVRLRGDLRARGAKIWIDHEALTPGTKNWDAAIRKGIKASDALIYLASPAALASENVQGELLVAKRFDKTIVPFWVQGEHWADAAPLNMGLAQYEDARGAHYADALERLCQRWKLAIAERAQPASPPAPAKTPAKASVDVLQGDTLASAGPTARPPAVASAPKPAASGASYPSLPAPGAGLKTQMPSWKLVAVVALLLLVVSGAGLLAWGAINQANQAAIRNRAGQTATAVERATRQSAQAELTAFALAALARFPYSAAAPGFTCDPAYASWQTALGDQGTSQCVSGKTLLTSVNQNNAVCGAFGFIHYDVTRGIVLPALYTISIVADPQTAATNVSLTLYADEGTAHTSIQYDFGFVTEGNWSSDVGPQAPGGQTTIAQGQTTSNSGHTLAMTLNGTTITFKLDDKVVASQNEPANLIVTSIALGVNGNCQPGAQADFANFSIS